MIVGIHQPNFMPWLGYFYKMAVADKFVYLDNVPYSKGSYTNRVQIKTQGGPRWLTVPVLTSGKLGQNIVELVADDHSAWRKKTLATLDGSYRKCPHFKTYFGDIQRIISSGPANLADLNIELIEYFAGQLGIATQTGKLRRVRSSALAAQGKATDLLTAICKELGADTYLSGSGGANYQDEQAFAAAGLKLIYAKYKHPAYPQAFGEFVSGLTIADLLFNCGPESTAILVAPPNLLGGV
jgi:hypothetical protein